MKHETKMWLNRYAGTSLIVEAEKMDKHTQEHMKKEHSLFQKVCNDMQDIHKMCTERLAEKDLSEEHRKQYEALCACTKKCCDLMSEHLESYK